MDELKDKRIVIVEDNVMNMAVYAVALRNSGAMTIQDPFNTDTVNKIKRNLPVDIILLDLMLRNSVTGYEVFDKLKADSDLKDIPVLAISAADPSHEIPKTKEKGFSGFISKPVDPFILVGQIVACIKGEQVWYSQENNKRGF